MTEQEYMVAVDAAVTRWHQDRRGDPLTCLAFDGAVPAQCHANAAAFVAKHGGEVVRGFLVMHPHLGPEVWVFPHSVVRTASVLVDVSLSPEQLRCHAFYPLFADIEDFVEQAQLKPELHRSIVS